MKKEFIPYEQALALKELGFDEPCLARFTDEETFITDDGELSKTQCMDFDFMCSAPLYQQVFRWFRNNYKLNSRVTEHINDNKYFYCIERLNVTKFEDVVVTWNTDMCISYEEAELESVKKLIEIVKTK